MTMRFLCRLTLLILLAFSAAITVYRDSSAQIESRYFPETGKTVRGEFLKKYESVPNPILVFGYPITDDYSAPEGSPASGLRIQYFQRARFDFNPDPTAEEKVIVAPLGRLLYESEDLSKSEEISPPFSPACRYFKETGLRTCYSFLDFYEANGDLDQFGLPISPIIKINGRLVQYFEYARFEWHPELPVGQRVLLTNIGKMYYDRFERYHRPSSTPPNNLPSKPITQLKVRAFVRSAVVSQDESQSIYVVVLDEEQKPVQGAQVSLTLVPSSGASKLLVLNVTDEKGITSTSISVKDFPIGIVEVKVTVNYSTALQKQTVTSFRVWY